MKFVQTDLSRKTRKMLLTINNPDKQGTTPNGFLVERAAIEDAIKGVEKGQTYIVETVKNYIDGSDLIKGKTDVYYSFSMEVGKEGTPHLHIFFKFENARFGNKVKKIFPTAHIDYCNGTSKSVSDYVNKRGKWEGDPKEDTKIIGTQYENGVLPEEKGQGGRTDLEMVKDLVESGMHPQEILDSNPNFYRVESYIRKMYFAKRKRETPLKRNVEVVVHAGISGSGKSYVMTTFDENKMFLATDYGVALFDGYDGEEIVFMDEFRGQIPYNQLLTIINGYKAPVHARYDNVLSLWNAIHITSVIPVEEWYKNENIHDTFEQLKRRIDRITFHFIYDRTNMLYIPDKIAFLRDHPEENIAYAEYSISAIQYTDYKDLEKEALASKGIMLAYCFDVQWPTEPTVEDEYQEWLMEKHLEDSDENFKEFWAWNVKKKEAAWGVA